MNSRHTKSGGDRATRVAERIHHELAQMIAREVKARDIDMLLMGAYACAHSPLRTLIFGSKTTDLLRAATIPTLLLRAYSG